MIWLGFVIMVIAITGIVLVDFWSTGLDKKLVKLKTESSFLAALNYTYRQRYEKDESVEIEEFHKTSVDQSINRAFAQGLLYGQYLHTEHARDTSHIPYGDLVQNHKEIFERIDILLENNERAAKKKQDDQADSESPLPG